MKIKVMTKSVYGVDRIYPICDAAKALANIAGNKTISAATLRHAKVLGIEAVAVAQPLIV